MLHYIANGFETHLVSVTYGDALGCVNFLNGQTASGTPVVCPTPADHPWTHSPTREGYAPLTLQAVGEARIKEARTALGLMSMVPPINDSNGNPITPGSVVHHIGGLSDGFGDHGLRCVDAGSSSSTSPPTRAGIDAAKAVILPYVQNYPNSFHITTTPADHHHDHAACGIALREIKTENPTLLGTPMFFISRLYWTVTNGLYAEDLRVAAGGLPGGPGVGTNGTIAWFTGPGVNYTTYANHLRNRVVKAFRSWNPAAGSYGIGYHQVSSQFEANFGPTASVANLFHT